MIYNVISSTSMGNAIIYHDSILLDIGVSYKHIKPHANKIGIVLLTHSHNDHINIDSLKKLQADRPMVRVGCCSWMVPYLEGIKNIDVYEIGKIYDYGLFKISPIKLYHDVPNCGYRIFKDEHKIIHATDTAHMNGITATNYDLYAIEHNHHEDYIDKAIEHKIMNNEFSYEVGSRNSHLSHEQAFEFIDQNSDGECDVLMLHRSDQYG